MRPGPRLGVGLCGVGKGGRAWNWLPEAVTLSRVTIGVLRGAASSYSLSPPTPTVSPPRPHCVSFPHPQLCLSYLVPHSLSSPAPTVSLTPRPALCFFAPPAPHCLSLPPPPPRVSLPPPPLSLSPPPRTVSLFPAPAPSPPVPLWDSISPSLWPPAVSVGLARAPALSLVSAGSPALPARSASYQGAHRRLARPRSGKSTCRARGAPLAALRPAPSARARGRSVTPLSPLASGAPSRQATCRLGHRPSPAACGATEVSVPMPIPCLPLLPGCPAGVDWRSETTTGRPACGRFPVQRVAGRPRRPLWRSPPSAAPGPVRARNSAFQDSLSSGVAGGAARLPL